MSSRLSRCIKSLESAGFLRSVDHGNRLELELLPHGAAYAKQLKYQWLNMRQLAVNLGNVSTRETESSPQRFSFVHSKQFRQRFQELRETHPSKAKCPTLVKQQCSSTASTASNALFQFGPAVTQLITDFYVEPHRGLEHFYNLQRESKIWWMRYSSNPSRYAIVPYESDEEREDLQKNSNSQAIDIKAAFGDSGAMTVEQLSLVTLPDDKHFLLSDGRTGKLLLPAVIRSVIELETASCAMLLDGCDHSREARSLLLNRVLAPYQCGIAGIQQGTSPSSDLRDLCAHMVDVLQRAKLRLQLFGNESYTLSQSKDQLAEQLQQSDCLGVPYMLLLDEQQSLSHGLMQLRSRDTQLAEIIHISDVPDYLLNIFRNF